MQKLGPHFKDIKAELADVHDMKEKPAGMVRITGTDYSANTLVWPKLGKVLSQYPELRIEVVSDYALADIAAERFDIGVRWGTWWRWTWWPSASDTNAGWSSWGPPRIFKNTLRLKRRSNLWRTTASTCASPLVVDSWRRNVRRRVSRCRSGWQAS
ncbi:hypothetical protein [Serratia plymuthica]|uniref:hypothetical protein n=1 Tax=Serratia plymuthica TaxID=82996 RepID=UPI0014197081|nr:hypothetical protein [Serratia plymuthica]NIC28524.1 hypothetical protein [Serratia plymuthica]